MTYYYLRLYPHYHYSKSLSLPFDSFRPIAAVFRIKFTSVSRSKELFAVSLGLFIDFINS